MPVPTEPKRLRNRLYSTNVDNAFVADINPARTDPGGGLSPMVMERPAQAGTPAGRHRREACSFLSPDTREPEKSICVSVAYVAFSG